MENYHNKSKDELIQEIEKLKKQMMGVNSDINQKMKTSESETEHLSDIEHEKILASIDDIIFVFDADQRFTFVNTPDTNKLYVKPDQFIGKKTKDVMPNTMHHAFNAAFEKNRKGTYTTFDYQLERNKQTHYFTARLSPIFENDEFKGSVATVTDITEQTVAEQKLIEQTNQLKLINTLNNAVNKGSNLNELLRLFAEETKKLFKGFSAVVYLLDKKEENLELQSLNISNSIIKSIEDLIGIGIPKISMPIQAGNIYFETINSGVTKLYTGEKNIRRFIEASAETNTIKSHLVKKVIKKSIPVIQSLLKIKSVIHIPLFEGKKVIGLTELSSKKEFEQHDLDKIIILSGQVNTIINKKISEIELFKSEYKLKLFADYNYDWEYWINEQGEYVYISPSCERIAGYTAQEFKDNPDILFKIVHPNYAENVHKHYHIENNKNTPVFESDFQIITKTGETKWINHNCNPIFDEQGIYLGRRGNNRDITEEKLAKLKLQESETKFKNVFENSLVGFSITGLDGSLYTNKAFSDILGYSQKELESINWQDITHPEDLEISNSVVRALLNKSKNNVRFEKRYIHKKGHTVFVDNSVVLHTDDKGKAQYFISAINDQTEKRKAETELKNSEEKYKKTFYTSPDSINITRVKDGLYININEGFTRMIGYTANEAIGKTSLELNIWNKPDDRQKLVNELNSKGYIENLEAEFKTKTGKIITGLMSATFIKLNGEDCNINVTRDITERKKTEKELEDYRNNLEETVRERTKELEQKNKKLEEYNELFIGREFRIKELRNKIEELEGKK